MGAPEQMSIEAAWAAPNGGDARTVGLNDGHRVSADYERGEREQER